MATRIRRRCCGRWQYVSSEYPAGNSGGRGAARILWRPFDEHTAGFLPAPRDNDGAGQCSLRPRTGDELALHDWPGQAGGRDWPTTGEGECRRAPGIRSAKGIFNRERQEAVAKGACGADARWSWHPDTAGRLCVSPAPAVVDFGTGAADCLREYREPAAGKRHGKADRNVSANGPGSDARKNRSAALDGKRFAGRFGWPSWVGRGICRNPHAAVACLPRRPECPHRGDAVLWSHWVRVCVLDSDGYLCSGGPTLLRM